MSNHPAPPIEIVALDIETTSLQPGAEVWEFGAVRRYQGGAHSTTTFMLGNPNLRNADQQSLRVGRFYERHPGALVSYGAPITPGPAGLDDASERLTAHFATVAHTPQLHGASEFARRIARFTHDAVLLVNNPAFDVPRLERVLREQGIAPGWHYRAVDVVALAAGRLVALKPYLESELGPASTWGSELVSTLLGVRLPDETERHTALGDARWVLRLYDAATGRPNPADGEARA